jgi:nitroreductase
MSVAVEDIQAFLCRLRAVKDYTAEPVSQEAIEAILEVGRWTGTGSNRQSTEVIVIRDPAVKQQLGAWGAAPAATAAVVLLLVVKDDASALDEGRMAERLCLGAAAVGLGSTVATIKNEGPDEVKPLLGIPAEHRVRTLIAIGHTDAEARRARLNGPQRSPTGRKPLSEFAHWDRF